ncbi:hypothetical protein N7466_005596 [Penicillium verhagenii]|uniref:uncharacterized protein n=1 Tax=Penicillium verhagenii TaxID=1562060 RepID=UPI00254550D2|nr:uncharacterized protein N7466_005596 [Penicillium verhagenii]KAJ5930103.1 hypothetical protein N7466_005596 [Penicillium verhagenii]
MTTYKVYVIKSKPNSASQDPIPTLFVETDPSTGSGFTHNFAKSSFIWSNVRHERVPSGDPAYLAGVMKKTLYGYVETEQYPEAWDKELEKMATNPSEMRVPVGTGSVVASGIPVLTRAKLLSTTSF